MVVALKLKGIRIVKSVWIEWLKVIRYGNNTKI